MGLFFKKKKKDPEPTPQPPKDEYELYAEFAKFAKDEESKKYYTAQADREYQTDLKKLYALYDKIRERYTVINNVGSFFDASADMLIADCLEAFDLNMKTREKAKYYGLELVTMATELKTLAMVYEKRQEYNQAAMFCAMAIENGFTSDGTAGGMRGRLARMIKKGNIELTDQLRDILEIQ